MSKLVPIRGTENSQRRGDVVFIHGLNGDARTTWHPEGQPKDFWPDWIGADIANIGVWSIGYEVNSFGWAGSTMPLADRAVNALFLLDTDGIGTERPVVFITHSLGGLLVKEMLRKATDNSVPEGRQLAERTRGVIFLSTPHTGSDLASFVDFMKFLLPTESVKELKPNEPRLRELNTWYRNNVNKLGIKTQVYCERKPTTAGKGFFKRFGKVVVDANSADPGLEGVTATPLDEDHLSISCPKRESAQYRGISKFVQACFVTPENQPPVRPINLALEKPIELETPGGKMPLESPFYIKREPSESLSFQEVKKDAGLVRIRAPRQMGKTSLLARINDHAHQQGYSIVSLSFQELEEELFADLAKFLQTFCVLVGDALNIPAQKIRTYWAENDISPKRTCGNCFRDCILAAVPEVLVLGLDEIDVLFPHTAVAREFFQMLRAWNEKGKDDPNWAKLRLILVHSTELYAAIMDVNSSPFNIGLQVELKDFEEKEVAELAIRHKLPLEKNEVQKLMAMIGGRPYLVRLALWHLAQGELTLDQLLSNAPTDAGIYSEHLGRLLGILERYAPLKEAFIAVLRTEQPISLEQALSFKLNGLGLIIKDGNLVSLRYPQLYRPYFCNQFGLS
jgi:protein SERAC1